MKVRHEQFVGRGFNRECESAFSTAFTRSAGGDLPEAVQHRLHRCIHPFSWSGGMPVVAGEAGERGASGVLVQELYPIEAVINQPLDQILGDFSRPCNAQTTRVTRPPGLVPILRPTMSIVRLADGFLPLLRLKVLCAVVPRPEMAGNPTRAVAIA